MDTLVDPAQRQPGDAPYSVGGHASFFRVAPPDDGEAAALVRFAIRRLHSTSFAVASDGQAYGTVLRSRFNAALSREHEGIAYSGNFDPTLGAQVDAFLAAAKRAGADTVLYGGRADGGGCRMAAKLAASLGAGATLLGGGGLAAASCEADAGAASPSVYTVGEGMPQDAGLAARVLIEAIATAIKEQGGNLPTRDQVRLAVSRSRVVAFDADGDPLKGTFTVYQGKAPTAGAAPASTWAVAGTVGG